MTIWEISALAFGVLAIFSAKAAYHNGFRDGALWVAEGDGYPSRPRDSWWGYGQLKRRIGDNCIPRCQNDD